MAIEGPRQCGKSTLASMLAKKAEKRGLVVAFFDCKYVSQGALADSEPGIRHGLHPAETKTEAEVGRHFVN